MISFLGEVVASGYLFLEKVERQSFQAAKWTEHGLEVNEKRGNQNDCECFACLTACILISVPLFVTQNVMSPSTGPWQGT